MMRVSLLVGLLVALSAVTSSAHDHGSTASPGGSMSTKAESWSAPTRQEKAHSYFTDLAVIAQDG
ncbi:MAG: hypothetical protein WAO08_08260, partial [Hyphomicrobiaceae bacterium]